MTTRELWDAVLAAAQLDTSKAHFQTFFKNTQAVSLNDGTLKVACPNSFVKDTLTEKFLPQIKSTIQDILDETCDLEFVLEPSLIKEQKSLGPLFTPPQQAQENRREVKSGLCDDYTFENFVVGFTNRLAHATALVVSESPGHLHNPLFIYSGVGLGKTHLMHAVGNALSKKDTEVLYVSAEAFANELIESIQNKFNAKSFREKYRSVDLLLVDDIQFIAGKEATQEEFFNTFNSLYFAKKQVVVSADKPPREIKGLEERIISRFAGGVVADIQPPDLDLRIAILKRKAKDLGVGASQDVLQAVAEEITENIRELEGALKQVAVLTEVYGRPLDVKEVQSEVLGKAQRGGRLKLKLSPQKIIMQVCAYYTIKEDELKGERRIRSVARPRQVAMYLLRSLGNLPLSQIGELLGGRDHTTILHGIEKVEKLIQKDWQTGQQVQVLKREIAGSSQ